MATIISEAEKQLKIERIKQLSKGAAIFFDSSNTNNIFEDGQDSLKIVKLYDPEQNPIFFLIIQKLGAGAFGEVSRAMQLDIDSGIVIPNTDVAIKITDFTEGGTLGKIDRQNAQERTEHEYDILRRIQQSNAFSIGQRVKTVEIDIGEGQSITQEVHVQEAVVVMPLHSGKDIHHEEHKDQFSYGSITFAELAAKLCANLEKLHNNNIIHSDLKPANIIWDPLNNQANIVDFNNALVVRPNEKYVFTSYSSDRAYMAGDCFAEKGYRFSKVSDIYSLGKILAEKFNINIGDGQHESLNNKKHLSYDQLIIQSFLQKMMADDVTLRPTINECKEFFTQIENKMKFDIEQPDNQTRLELNKKLISWEICANRLRNEIYQQAREDKEGASAGITKKYEQAIKSIELLNRALSTSEINMSLVEKQLAETNVTSMLGFKGIFQEIIMNITSNDTEDNSFRPK